MPDHYPASVRQQTLRFGDSWARIAPWRGGGGAAHLVVGPDASVPSSVVHRCIERARASGYDSVLTSAVSPAESGVFVDAGFSVRERLHLLALDLDTAPGPGPAPAREGHPARPHPGARARRPLVRRASGASVPSGSRTRSTPRPATRFRVGRDGDRGRRLRDHRRGRPVRLPPAGGGAPRRAVPRLGPRPRGRRPRLGVEARRRPRVRQHPTGERSRARALPVVRLRHPSPRACASSGGPCDPARPRHPRGGGVLRRPVSPPSRRPGRAGRGAVVRARRPEPVGGSRRHVPDELPGRERAARVTGSCSRCTIPLESRTAFDAERQRRWPPAVAQPHPVRVRRAADRRQRPPDPAVPHQRDLQQRRVPPRGRPARAPATSRSPTSSPTSWSSPWAPTARSPSEHPSRWPGSGHCEPNPPTWATRRRRSTRTRSPTSSRRAGSAARPSELGGEPRRAAHAGAQPETLDAWNTLAARSPDLAAGVAAVRSAGLRNQVLTGPFVPLDLPVDPARTTSAGS